MSIRVTAVLVAVVVAVPACSGSTPPDRRVMAEIIGQEMYTEVDSALTSRTLRASQDRSEAARGRPDGYRRAVVLRHAASECDPHRAAVDCGAKVEIFRTAAQAESRDRSLDLSKATAPPAESRVRVGAVLLRLSGGLEPDQRAEYHQALCHALGSLSERLQQKADFTAEERVGQCREAGVR